MVQVLLHKIDEKPITASFVKGEHILGRGSTLECTSKKVSRKHGLLKVTSEDVLLSSTNNNPFFHQNGKDNNISLVTFGETVQLYNGDKIALSLEDGWYRVEIKETTIDDCDCDAETTAKRPLDKEDEPCSKKQKLEDNVTEIPICTKTQELSEIAIKTEPVEAECSASAKQKVQNDEDIGDVQVKTEVPEESCAEESSNNRVSEVPDGTDNVKEEPPDTEATEVETKPENLAQGEKVSEDEVDKNEDKSAKKQEGTKNDTTSNDNAATSASQASTSSSSPRVWRDRCWYGAACYRKNQAHKAQFSHPNDSDYESDPEDPRPICCYGVSCYRKNTEHRKRYWHPGQKQLGKRPTAPRRKMQAKPKKPKPTKDTSAAADSDEEDDYDYSDPFINDASSDEYEPSSSSEPSETESEYEEDDIEENNKRLLREAKRFMKT